MKPDTAGVSEVAISCSINDRAVERVVPVHRLLIDFLREDLGLTGTKRSCDLQVCGACTVLVDGATVSSCTMLAFEIDERAVVTIEGLGSADELDPIQEEFINRTALQCGFCTPGMILAAKALLSENSRPNDVQIRDYLAGNLCRCTGYKKIVEAVAEAALRTEV